MGIISCVALIICGILASATFIVQKKPNAKELIDKLTPFQGIIGIIVCLWGLWWAINLLLHISGFTTAWIIVFAIAALDFALGFLLGFALIAKIALSGNPTAMAKGEALRGKIAGMQIPLGLVAIVLGLYGLITSFIHI